jgi:hypothetical protein
MGQRIVKQPNGKYAAFSDIVDHFIAYDATREEALQFCVDKWKCTTAEAEEKVQRGDDDIRQDGSKGRYEEAVNTIRVIHGAEEVSKYRNLLEEKSCEV